MRTSGVFIPTFEDWVPAVSFLEVSTKFRENVHNIWRRAVNAVILGCISTKIITDIGLRVRII